MLTSTGFFPTANGSRFLQQLCKHFEHKVEVSFDSETGRAALGPGPVTLAADADGLTVTVSAEDVRGIIEARYIVDKHLVIFAFRDDFSGCNWKMDAAATA